jgi:acetolactate synthase I/II/III large subunit
MELKTSDIIAEFLEKLEIRTVFGIIGSANSHIFDSIASRGYTQIICVHHEQAAVMAMGAYFRTSGKLSAAIVTAGAGSSNAITGVVSNWADSIPGFIISGQEQSYHIKNYVNHRMYGIQGFNVTKMVADITKYAKTIIDKNTVQSELELAHLKTLDGRPGPVWLDFPFDVQAMKSTIRPWNLELPSTESSVDFFDTASYVLNCLKESKRPIIWGGHGIRLAGAKEEFRALVDAFKIPTILTWSAIDLLDEDNQYYYGRAGVSGQRHANFIVQNSDLILVLGSRLSLLQAGYDINNLSPNAKIIMVDIDPVESGKYDKRYDKYIMMDCKKFIKDIYQISQNSVTPTTFQQHEWLKYCHDIKKKYPLEEKSYNVTGASQYVNSYTFINEMCKHMHDDQIIVTDMGTALLSGHHSIKLTKNQTMFTSLGLGEMGYGLPGAIGASFAAPNRPVLCLNCDGGMMLNLQELQTIIHHNLPIKIIIFENDGYLMIKHTQKLLFKGNYTGVNQKTGVSCPDFYELGSALGFNTYGIDGNYTHLHSDILSEFFSYAGPAICVVHMNPEQEFIPKVKGVLQSDGKLVPASLEEMSPLLPYEEIKNAMPWGLNPKSECITRK